MALFTTLPLYYMPTYPPTHIHTPDGTVNILQLTDLHLCYDVHQTIAGCNVHQGFIKCLQQALNNGIRCDLILVTGDLINEMNSLIYDRIFEILTATGVPFACLPGNHDVTDELNEHLPFKERTLVAYPPDSRLLERHRIVAEDWQILLIDSSCPGEVGGEIDEKTLEWLQSSLDESKAPTVIALHHHIVSMQSRWIDEHIAKAADLFWQLVAKYPHVKAILNGHTHQEYVGSKAGITCYVTPSTCYQFQSNSDQFLIDHFSSPGYRWLQLGRNAIYSSWVERLKK